MIHSRTKGFSSYVRKRFVIGSYSLYAENQEKVFRKAQKIRRLIVNELDVYKRQEYDRYYQELLKLEDEFPQYRDPNSITQRVGGVVLDAFEKVSHKRRMLSLDLSLIHI